MKVKYKVLYLLSYICLFSLTGCLTGGFSAGEAPSTGSSGGGSTNSGSDLISTKLGQGTTSADILGNTYAYELYKLKLSSNEATFAQWIPAASGTQRPAVLLYLPYEGINWTGLGVDNFWDGLGTGTYPDFNGPAYDSGSASRISYTSFAPQNAGASNYPFTYNDINILIVYGRFYAGGDLQNDVNDVLTGLEFLNQHPKVETSKIGFYASSWGALVGLYAIQQADSGKKPLAAALVSPVSDVSKMKTYIQTLIPTYTADTTIQGQYTNYLDPHLRRLDKATESLTGQPERYDAYSHTALSTAPATQFFTLHDTWDTLAPATMTTDLMTALGNRSTDLKYFHLHDTAINFNTFALEHYQATQKMKPEMTTPLAQTFLLNRLLPTTAHRIFYNSAELNSLFTHTRDRKVAGGNSSFFTAVLNELCNDFLTMQDTTSSVATADGKTILNSMLYTYIGVPNATTDWDVDTTTICNRLNTASPF